MLKFECDVCKGRGKIKSVFIFEELKQEIRYRDFGTDEMDYVALEKATKDHYYYLVCPQCRNKKLKVLYK